MPASWQDELAERIADDLNVQPGEVIQVRDRTGRLDVLASTLLAIERRGGAPFLEYLPPSYVQRLLTEVPVDLLSTWDQGRKRWNAEVDKVLVLAGADPAPSGDPAVLARWQEATARLTELEEQSRKPYLLAAVPTEAGAWRLGMQLSELEETLLPALLASPAELIDQMEGVLRALAGSNRIVVHSGGGRRLALDRAGRAWLLDTGRIQPVEGIQPVNNLPAGAMYTTVNEESAEGSVVLGSRPGEECVLHFRNGQVMEVEGPRAREVRAMLEEGGEDAGRISHIGLGLNPYVRRPLGWTLVDEHAGGAVLLALGENRYLGGKNASTLNADFVVAGGRLEPEQAE